MTSQYSTPSALLGALLGGFAGYTLANLDELRGKGWGGKSNEKLYVGAATAISAVVGGYLGANLGATPTPAAAPAVPGTSPALIPTLQNVADSVPALVDIQVAAGQTLNVSAPVGAPVIVWPAFGGKWVSVDGAPVANNVAAPFAFQMAGAITHTYVWTDTTTNTTQTCTINFSVPPPVAVATI